MRFHLIISLIYSIYFLLHQLNFYARSRNRNSVYIVKELLRQLKYYIIHQNNISNFNIKELLAQLELYVKYIRESKFYYQFGGYNLNKKKIISQIDYYINSLEILIYNLEEINEQFHKLNIILIHWKIFHNLVVKKAHNH